MKRTKLKDRKLPDYTRGEEIFNMVSHIVGGAFGIAALATCVVRAFIHGGAYEVVSAFIYGFSMILLYTMSSVYHGFKPEAAKKGHAGHRSLHRVYTYRRYIYPCRPLLAQAGKHRTRLDGIRNSMGRFGARHYS